ncbi:MAG: hypothetical protein WCF38_13135, partial [Pseudolabrys sp.]
MRLPAQKVHGAILIEPVIQFPNGVGRARTVNLLQSTLPSIGRRWRTNFGPKGVSATFSWQQFGAVRASSHDDASGRYISKIASASWPAVISALAASRNGILDT